LWRLKAKKLTPKEAKKHLNKAKVTAFEARLREVERLIRAETKSSVGKVEVRGAGKIR